METYALYGDAWQLTIQKGNRVELQRGIPFDYNRTTSFIPDGDDSGAVLWEVNSTLGTLENKALFVQGMFNEMNTFCECILSNRKPDIGSLEFALDIMQVYEGSLRSGGKTVYID
jgi:hypothetical protein